MATKRCYRRCYRVARKVEVDQKEGMVLKRIHGDSKVSTIFLNFQSNWEMIQLTVILFNCVGSTLRICHWLFHLGMSIHQQPGCSQPWLSCWVGKKDSVWLKPLKYTQINIHSYIAMETRPFEDVFPMENGDIPLLFGLPECIPQFLEWTWRGLCHWSGTNKYSNGVT